MTLYKVKKCSVLPFKFVSKYLRSFQVFTLFLIQKHNRNEQGSGMVVALLLEEELRGKCMVKRPELARPSYGLPTTASSMV